MGRQSALIAVIAALALSVAGYFAWPMLQGPSPFSGTGTTAVLPDPKAEEKVITADPYKEPQRPDFAFRRLEIETSSDTPEACLVFTRTLDSSGKTRYEDYLVLDPKPQIAVRASTDRLCIAGLAFNEQYTLELREGLPSADGEKLASSETIPVQLRDQEAKIAFGPGFILPRESAGGVPITTINVDEIQIRVMRVGDRLLSQLRTGIVDEREIYPYEANNVEQEEGALVWEGRLKTQGPRNQAITSMFPLRDVLPKRAPGVYMIVAKNAAAKSGSDDEYDYDWNPVASQWVVDTDMGLTTFQGEDGLNVFVRSFQSAGSTSGVRVALIARNNEILGEGTTDSSGRVNFAPGLLRGAGGNQPVVIMAYGANDDFAFLDLRRPAFDLTDRGVDGRAQPGPVDAYLYLDRGIYRPGETVHLTTLLRDRAAAASADMPLTIVIQRPDGAEFRRFTNSDQEQGAAYTPFTLTATAPRGRWGAAAYTDPEAQPIARIGFDVQDFVPQRLKVTLDSKDAVLKPGAEFEIGVESRFLYGAPAAGLSGEGEIVITSDSEPFPELKGYRFGRVDERFDAIYAPISVDPTDASGKSRALGAIGPLNDTSLALKATVRVSLFEPGGRTTDERLSFPVRTRAVMIGLKPMFDDDSVREGTEAGFEIIAVDAAGKPVARPGLTYELVREEYDYRWYRTPEGEWRYESVQRDRIMKGGTIDVAADAPAKFGEVVQWGSYRLTVIDPASGASTSLRFWGGWGAGAANDRPDRVAVLSDKPQYKPGETARLEIRAPTDGKAMVAIATDRIISSQMVDVSASGTVVEIPVSADWGGGAYALVTHYRPLASAETRAPVRAIGLTYLSLDVTERTLSVDVGTPERVTPRGKIEVPLTITGARANEETFVTLAAVDEGILQLTDFVSPDPGKFFFGKRMLGLQIRDDYGRLIRNELTQVGELRSGGDGFGGRSLAVVPQRTVAMYTGPVKVVNGKASITLDLPDFNGELRLMAVAFGPSAVGSSSKPLTVRDAVVGEIVFPRFLAPGDEVSVGLNLHNVEGAAGEYRAIVKASGPLSAGNGEITIAKSLNVGQRELVPVTLRASETGIATVTLALEGPNGFKVERAWPIEVRPPQLPVTRETVTEFKPGEVVSLGRDIVQGFVPGTESVSVTVAGARGFSNVAGQLRWLDRYPYGCLEQTTSRAFPLVYFNDMALLAGVKTDERIETRVQEAIDRIFDQQMWSGSFGMWLGAQEESDGWLSVFATDFILQAQAKGYVVPREGAERALKWLKRMTVNDGYDDAARSYGFYVLARQGLANASDLRYFFDTRGQNVYNAIGAGMLATALTQIGDKARAAKAFERANALALQRPIEEYLPVLSYDSALRDAAGLIAMAAESGQSKLATDLIARIERFNTQVNYTTTQEKAWMLLAAHKIEENAAPVSVDAKGVSRLSSGRTLSLSPTLEELGKGVTLQNTGSAPVWQIVSVEGAPSDPLPAARSGGLEVNKTYFSLDGTPLDPAQVKQNDRFIVLITGSAQTNVFRQMAVMDLLPAGFDIEAPVVRNDDGTSLYGFLPLLTAPSIMEARDDRFVAAFTIGDRYRSTNAQVYAPSFALAYLVRAVTPGSFVLPAVYAEDMYAPDVYARTEMSRVTIAAAR